MKKSHWTIPQLLSKPVVHASTAQGGLGWTAIPGMAVPGFPDRKYDPRCKPKNQNWNDALQRFECFKLG